jgi:hypothetical protein
VTPADATALGAVLLGERVRSAVRLSGGLLNHVFRLILDDGRSVILKHAPPHIASQPDIPLDPSRASFEAAALHWLQGRPETGFATPRLLAHDDAALVMSDLGVLPDLSAWLSSGGSPAVLGVLARVLRRLHEDGSAPLQHNLPIQQTRLVVQYQAIGGLLARAGVADAAALGERAVALGDVLLGVGDTFVMGDLWPPSVLVGPRGRLSLIDWEMSTTGRRCQDLGHLAAHLWLGAARQQLAPSLDATFLNAYGPVSPRDEEEVATHFAAEILVRTHGAFQPTPSDPPAVQSRALAEAVAVLRGRGSYWLRMVGPLGS